MDHSWLRIPSKAPRLPHQGRGPASCPAQGGPGDPADPAAHPAPAGEHGAAQPGVPTGTAPCTQSAPAPAPQTQPGRGPWGEHNLHTRAPSAAHGGLARLPGIPRAPGCPPSLPLHSFILSRKGSGKGTWTEFRSAAPEAAGLAGSPPNPLPQIQPGTGIRNAGAASRPAGVRRQPAGNPSIMVSTSL